MEQQDDAVTAYVRLRLRELVDGGMEQQEIARRTGLSKGVISAHRTRSGVGAKAARAYAKLFGFADVEQLRRTALGWLAEPVADVASEAKEAAELVVNLGQATPAQVATILAAFAHPRWLGRDTAWWTTTLLAESARDRAEAPRPMAPETPANHVGMAKRGRK